MPLTLINTGNFNPGLWFGAICIWKRHSSKLTFRKVGIFVKIGTMHNFWFSIFVPFILAEKGTYEALESNSAVSIPIITHIN